MKITIHQPNFLPYLGFFDKCDYSDILVIYDSTKFSKNGFQNRNKIRTKEGYHWLTVPVSHNSNTSINKVKIVNSEKWKNKHLKSLEINYSKSKFYKYYITKIRKIYNKEWEFLSDLNETLINFLIKELGIKCKIIKSSEFNIKTKSNKALLDICKKLNANIYISGEGGKNYLDLKLFNKENIKVLFQNYQHPKYKQTFPGFQPYMNILDLLFNHGNNSLKIIRSGRNFKGKLL